MSPEPDQFNPQQILDVLDRHHVDYVIVGGFGSQLHGARRQTFDIDLVPSTTTDNYALVE